jgi:ABC-2 type transport system permease protein
MSDLRAMFVVARRELLERVRSKWYVAATLLGPLFIVAMIVVPALIASSSTAGTRVDIVDRSGVLAPGLAEAFRSKEIGWTATIVDPTTSEADQIAKIGRDEINGFIVIDRDVLANGKMVYQGDNASAGNVQAILREVTRTLLTAERAKAQKLSKAQIEALLAPVDLDAKQNTGAGEGTSGMASFLVGYAIAFILYMVITLYGVTVMRSVVMEKTSRVMELMVAAVKPRALMAGKILGVGGAGLLQVGIWLGMGALAIAHRNTILGWFGAKSDLVLPDFGPTEITVVLAFFVLGFFFYSAMYAAVGAMVSSEQDTQQVQMPVTMLLVIGLLCINVVSNAPRGSSSVIMSNVPLWSAMLMPMRYVLGGATLGEVLLSLALLLVSTLVIVRVAAKIYRVGVLMYGKRPGARELLRWLRY